MILRKNYVTLFVLLLLLTTIVAINCNKSSDIVFEPNNISNETSSQIVSLSFVLPDTLPEIISEKAFELAKRSKYTDYRILKIDNSLKDIYNVTYFSEGDFQIISSINFEVDLINYSIIDSADVTQQVEFSLKKSTTTSCWDLGIMSLESPFNAAYAFPFGQSATGYGWFSKVIYDLRNTQQQCIGTYYTGGYNDNISSNRWRDDTSNKSATGYIGRPYRLSVYKDANAQGVYKRWVASGYSSNYEDPEVSIDIVNYDSWVFGGTSTTVNNNVTSILFEYRVFTPTE